MFTITRMTAHSAAVAVEIFTTHQHSERLDRRPRARETARIANETLARMATRVSKVSSWECGCTAKVQSTPSAVRPVSYTIHYSFNSAVLAPKECIRMKESPGGVARLSWTSPIRPGLVGTAHLPTTTIPLPSRFAGRATGYRTGVAPQRTGPLSLCHPRNS